VNRIDRLFAITTQLQSRGRVRAQDLAAHFEVSLRTIYRDVAALSESGVPIVSLPGQGYALADGYFLPPLRLSTPEASALVLGARLLASSASPTLAAAARDAEAKIISLLGHESRRYLDEIDQAVELTSPQPNVRFDLEEERVFSLWRAILERRVVSLRYFGRNRAQQTVREVEPRRLGYVNGAWYLSGYCRLRQAERDFRLDRIEEFTVGSSRFRPRPIVGPLPPAAIEIVVRFTGSAIRWVQEQQHWSFVSAVEADDALIATYRPDVLDEIAAWILGWGTAAEALSPPQLRDHLKAEARGIVQMLT
jgi:predicted DNA-binding transcriptional regulator YafY